MPSSSSFSHSSDLSSYVNSNETLTNEDINTFVFPKMLKQISKFQNSFLDDRNSGTIAGRGGESNNQHQHLHGQLEKLRGAVKNVEESFNKLTGLEQFLDFTVQSAVRSVALTVKEVTETPQPQDSTTLQISDVQTKLNKLNDIVMNLRLLVHSSHTISSNLQIFKNIGLMLSSNLQHRMEPSSRKYSERIDDSCKLSSNKFFRRSSAFEDIRQIYSSLGVKLKLCLLCFSVFPEGAVLKRRVLLYWWIGEGLIVQPITSAKTVEDLADDILKEFVMKGLINPVGNNRCRPFAKRFVMPYLIRSVVIQLAKEAEFADFDLEGHPTTMFLGSYKACLTEEESSFSTLKSSVKVSKQLRTLFNVSNKVLKFEADFFIGLKYLCVLQLGRWNSSAKHDIKVKETGFLKRLEKMKHLFYFSLQGISGIKKLPDTIGRLINLRILDLRDCYNLEVLPEGIASLKNLTHLDLSDCYFLSSLPKGIASLSELQVLKGFLICDPDDFRNSKTPCSLGDLTSLRKLRKLSISTGRVAAFPTEKDLESLQKMKALRKLKIAWGWASSNQSKAALKVTALSLTLTMDMSQCDEYVKRELATSQELPTSLEKLELQSFPHSKKPHWLNPRQLTSLKKLYIRGGALSDLVHANEEWTVEILSLKYLGYLEMNWPELQKSFPYLMFFEKVQCPKVTFCPCDYNGRWRNQDEDEENEDDTDIGNNIQTAKQNVTTTSSDNGLKRRREQAERQRQIVRLCSVVKNDNTY